MIVVSDLIKRYPGFELNCSLTVKTGRISGLIGRNGAGKSTLFKCILNLSYPDSGEIKILNKEVDKLSDIEKRNISTVLADSGFSGYITIKDIKSILKSFYPDFKEDWFIRKCLEYNLAEDKKVKELSAGMKAKLNVLCALCHDSKVLILDEVTVGLDVIARDEILDLLRDYMAEDNERSILISSHISSDLEGLCDDIYMIENGKIILHEDTDVLLDNYALIKVNNEDYEKLDKTHLLKRMKELFGYVCLTDNKHYYLENYENLVIEKGGIDSLIQLMIKGEDL